MRSVLLLTIAFSPNVGGIETHFDDLVSALAKRGWKVDVLTYKPITTPVPSKTYEKGNKKVRIFRIPWPKGLFLGLVRWPILEFMYLVPGLFFSLPIFLLLSNKTNVIHSHGLAAGFVGVFWGKIFRKRTITTTHSVYNFPKNGRYRSFAKWIFDNSDKVLVLSIQSKNELEKLGVDKSKIDVFTYWVDLDRFRPSIKKEKSGLTVLFVGRLVKEKGVEILLKSALGWGEAIKLKIIGFGPLEKMVEDYEKRAKNITFLGRVANSRLPGYYQKSDLLVVPSIHEEGFGRVILESLASGTPVVGARRGAISEAMDNTVGRLIKVNIKNISDTVDYFYKNPGEMVVLKRNARKYALERYTEHNVEKIIKAYEK